MVILWILLGILAALAAGSYGVYRQVFYHLPGTELKKAYPEGKIASHMMEKARELDAVPCQRISIQGEDGTPLSARLYDAPEGAPIVVACHGYKTAASFNFGCIFPFYREMGFRILVIDQRAHGQSGSHTISLGLRESHDVSLWVKEMERRFGTNTLITLWGISMGGNSVLCASALCPELKCVVSDCAFTGTQKILTYLAKCSSTPWLKKPYGLLVILAARLWGGFSSLEDDACKAVQGGKIPLLIIHGEEDRFVPYEMGKEIYAAATAPKEFLSVPDAKHANSAAVHPELYRDGLRKFLARYVEA